MDVFVIIKFKRLSVFNYLNLLFSKNEYQSIYIQKLKQFVWEISQLPKK